MEIKDLRDVRQLKCLELYRNPKSETFGNLKQSAISAGFDESYSNSLMARDPAWLSAGMKKDVDMVLKAERSMQKILNVDISFNNKTAVDVARLQFEVAKFVAKTLAKQKYSEAEDNAPPNVQINIIKYGQDNSKVIDVEEKIDVEAHGA